MTNNDNCPTMTAWYFRLADLVAPYFMACAVAVALAAAWNLVHLF